MKIPLFPLGSVLFPDGLLPLRIFELRYTDMVRRCMSAGTPFGVVLIHSDDDDNHSDDGSDDDGDGDGDGDGDDALSHTVSSRRMSKSTYHAPTKPADAAHKPDPTEPRKLHYDLGTLATITDFDMREPGVLLIAATGGQRFQVLSTEVQADGLIVGEVMLMEPDAPTPVPAEYEICSELMQRLLVEMDRQFANAVRANEAPFCNMVAKPYRSDEAVWLSNRHAELMPIPRSTKQSMLALTDPVERLRLIHAFLKGQDVI